MLFLVLIQAIAVKYVVVLIIQVFDDLAYLYGESDNQRIGRIRIAFPGGNPEEHGGPKPQKTIRYGKCIAFWTMIWYDIVVIRNKADLEIRRQHAK